MAIEGNPIARTDTENCWKPYDQVLIIRAGQSIQNYGRLAAGESFLPWIGQQRVEYP
jgi:hypothetical protein